MSNPTRRLREIHFQIYWNVFDEEGRSMPSKSLQQPAVFFEAQLPPDVLAWLNSLVKED